MRGFAHRRWLWGAVALVGVVGLVFHASMYCWWVFDDAFISMRYAENIARHMAFEYNLGERVEGYSNLLWTAQLALAFWLGLPMFPVARVLGLLASAGVLLLGLAYGLRAASRMTRDRRAQMSGLAILIVGVVCASPLAGHAMTGMETTQYAFLLDLAFLGGTLAAGGRPLWLAAAGIAMSLAILSRPEAFGYLPFFWAALILPDWPAYRARWSAARKGAGISGSQSLSESLSLHLLGLAILLPLVQFAALLAWRFMYYGSPLPLTVTAKAASHPGLEGLKDIYLFFTYGPTGWLWVMLAPLALAAVFMRLKTDESARPNSIVSASPSGGGSVANFRYLVGPLLLLTANCLFVLKVGGDILTFSRFMVPSILPVVLLLALAGARLTVLVRETRIVVSKLLWMLFFSASLTLFAGQASNLFHSVEYHSRQMSSEPKAASLIGWAAANLAEGRLVTSPAYYNGYSGLLVPLIQEEWMPGQSVVIGDIGLAGMLAPDVRIIDTNGLVTPVFARLSAEPDNPERRRAVLDELTAARPEWLLLVNRRTPLEILPGLPLAEWSDATEYEEVMLFEDWGDGLIQRRPVRFIAVLRRKGLPIPDARLVRRNYARLAEAFPESEVAESIRSNWERNADIYLAHRQPTPVSSEVAVYRIRLPDRELAGVRAIGEFEHPEMEGWTFEGDAMEGQPFKAESRPIPAQGFVGGGLIDTSRGDVEQTAGQGRAISPEFVPGPGDYLGFLIAGTCEQDSGVGLMVDGMLVRRWQGVNSALLRSVVVDLTPWSGQPVRVVVEDRAMDKWGWVMADHFILYREAQP